MIWQLHTADKYFKIFLISEHTAVKPLLHVLLHFVIPPTVALRKESGKLGVLKSGMCIPHGFDFNTKVSQLSCFWGPLMEQFYVNRGNLRLRLCWCWFSQDPHWTAGRGICDLDALTMSSSYPWALVSSCGDQVQRSKWTGLGGDAFRSTCGTRTAWQAHLPWQTLGWRWLQVAVSKGHRL